MARSMLLYWKIWVLKRSLLVTSSIAGFGLLGFLSAPAVAEDYVPLLPTSSNLSDAPYETIAESLQIRESADHPQSIPTAAVLSTDSPHLQLSFSSATTFPRALEQPNAPVILDLRPVPRDSITASYGTIHPSSLVVGNPKAGQVVPPKKSAPIALIGGFSPAAGAVGTVQIAQDSPAGSPLPNEDPELGIIRVRSDSEDPELGILRIREQPVVPETRTAEPPEFGFFTARFSAASSDNVLLAVNDVGGLTGDEFLRPAISLTFYPPVGPRTILIGDMDVGLQRYTTRSDLNYDDLRFRLGVRQGLFPRTYGQLMFTYQQLFRPGSPRFRFFENTAFSFTLGRRDPLTDQLSLNSYYQIQLNDAESRANASGPTDLTQFDRITQSLGGYLNYVISPQWQTGMSYQVTLSDYTGQERYDTYHQLLGQLVYRLTPDVRMSVYGGWSFGRSSEPRIRFDDTLFGISVDATVTLF